MDGDTDTADYQALDEWVALIPVPTQRLIQGWQQRWSAIGWRRQGRIIRGDPPRIRCPVDGAPLRRNGTCRHPRHRPGK